MGKIYVGLVKGETKREVIRCDEPPTFETHGQAFYACIGPFQTKRGAEFMAAFGQGNPHCQCVSDAERLAKKYASN